MNNTHFLSDQAMQKFIRDGYVSVTVDLPSNFHDALYDKTEKLFASVDNPSWRKVYVEGNPLDYNIPIPV